MKNKSALLKPGNSDEWSTPQDLFDELNSEFHFTIDAAASAENTKCLLYWDIEENGLAQNWCRHTVWCNPPYSNWQEWVRKAAESKCETVMLLPARTDTKAFHDCIYKKTEIRFIRGRLKFGDAKNSAPFPSMVVIFRG